MENLTYRAFYIYSLKNKKKNKKKTKKYLTLIERVAFSNKCMYKYYDYNILNLKESSIHDYKYFLNIYFYFINKYHLLNRSMLLKIYHFDLFNLNRSNNNLFYNVKIDDYSYLNLNKEIFFSYYCKFIEPKNKIRILYLK